MKKWWHYAGYSLEFITCLCLSITVITTFVQVLLRFVFSHSLPWTQEVVMISFVLFVLFGAALAVKHKEHLRVDILDSAPERIRRVLKVIEWSGVGVFIVILIYFGILLVIDNFRSGQVVGFLPLKVAYVYLSIPISGLYMLYYLIKGAIRS